MSRTERIHQIVHILETSRQAVPVRRFLDELEVSRATFKRDLDYLRDRLGAPIAWQPGGPERSRGYVLRPDPAQPPAAYGIRGLWFNQSEIYALLMMHKLAGSMQPGLIDTESHSLLARITHLLGSADDAPETVLSHIRILHSATRRPSGNWFEPIARATVRRRRLEILYYTRSRDSTSQRQVSPQRLLHYRENWYLLAWCHKADGLRLFALDAIRRAAALRQPARRVAAHQLDQATDGFGIFGGTETKLARLRFSPTAARWIGEETWHPRQRLRPDGDHLILELPYAQPRELAMEVMRHGRDFEVLGPPELRRHVEQQLREALAAYHN